MVTGNSISGNSSKLTTVINDVCVLAIEISMNVDVINPLFITVPVTGSGPSNMFKCTKLLA